LRTVLEDQVGQDELMLDVGSADGPSVGWLDGHGTRIMLDLDPRGLEPGGVCASAMALPFADETFDLACAFDVVEHCEPEALVLKELARVLKARGRLFISVPAYEWAWTEWDEEDAHYRRYTRPRAVSAVEAAGLTVTRSTYVFSSVFPFFAAERLARRIRRRLGGGSERHLPADITSVPSVHPTLERMFLWMCRGEERLLARRDLPFGSSVVVAAVKG
jgi:SAM-dependent methyltransferase